MSSDHIERRLAAILAADVAGSCRLIGIDEEGTLAQLKALRKTLFDPKVAEHHGRVVKNTGDGALVEFASVVDAVRCADEIQRGVAEQNIYVPQVKRIEFRIGIHVGDVIIEENDIFGDGVNIAVRFEGIAEPGGVSISDDAHRQIRGKIGIDYDDTGPQVLKNIAEPMRVWRARIGPSVSPAMLTKPPTETAQPLALPDKPSIAVLPFHNMSGDPEQEYFSDGMVEDIITALSRFKSLFVIARHSTFTYKGKAVDIKQIGRELGVRYVLEGSVRKAGGKLRITGQLIDATTRAHLWADRFDGPIDDIFELQDKITSSVVGAIAPRIVQAEIERSERKASENLDAVELYYRAIQSLRHVTREANDEALRLARQAISLDPKFSSAYGVAVACYIQRADQNWTKEKDDAEGKQYTLRAVELGADDGIALAYAAIFFALILHDVETADSIVDQAISVNPNLSDAWRIRGFISVYLGQFEPAIKQFEYAIRLNPLDPRHFYDECGLAMANFFLRRFEIALSWATKSMARQENYAVAISFAIMSYAMLGRLADAQMMLARRRGAGGSRTISQLRNFLPYRRHEDVDLIIEACRIAGVPE